jgi:hypothetical protein
MPEVIAVKDIGELAARVKLVAESAGKGTFPY